LLVYYHVMYIKLVMKYLSLCQLFYEFFPALSNILSENE
jgi:hypothetical protein